MEQALVLQVATPREEEEMMAALAATRKRKKAIVEHYENLRKPITEAARKNMDEQKEKTQKFEEDEQAILTAIRMYRCRLRKEIAQRNQELKEQYGDLDFLPTVSLRMTFRSEEGTVSVKEKPEITIDPTALPKKFFKLVPDETLIKSVLERGESIPGVTVKIKEEYTVR